MMSGNSQTNEWRIMRFSIDGILDSDWNFFQNINGNDIARSVDVSDNGEVYLGGYCNGGSGEQDWHIRKYYAPTEE
ncbi:MAG: hypothetical protein K9L66_12735 [Spirochaetaceae bacterium]|nr:hypothetical protein [Spirochaetaceae bacterium]